MTLIPMPSASSWCRHRLEDELGGFNPIGPLLEQGVQTVPAGVIVGTGCFTVGNYQDYIRAHFEEVHQRAEQYRREEEQTRNKALALLFSCLSREQREMYQLSERFIVETNGRRYELWKDPARNVRRLGEDGRPILSFCIHTYGLPREDELLGFKLLLESNEQEFLRTANATPISTI